MREKLLPSRISVSSGSVVKKETKGSEERYIAAFAPTGRNEGRESRKKMPRVFPSDPYLP